MGKPGYTRRILPLALSASLSIAVVWADAPEPAEPTAVDIFYHLTGAAPEGFEHLTAPQRGLVDVYFGNRRITSMLSTFTPEHISFDDPAAIVAALPESTDPAGLSAALTGDVPSNPDKVCDRYGDKECDALHPAPAAVVFDEDRFRADVFVHPDMLVVRQVVEDRFLPASESGFSLLQNFRANVAGSNRSESLFTLGSLTTAAYGQSRLVSQASYTDADELSFDNLFVQRDDREFEYRGGIFQTSGRGLSFAGEQDIGGVRFASTLNTRTDLAFAYGTPISVSLASRARVDILKDGRLVSSRFYDAGNQMLDTSALPEGAYDIEIRINEAGRTTAETRFFSKSSRLPPLDQPLYSFEAGALLNPSGNSALPEHQGDWVSRFGHSRRLTQTFGIDMGVAFSSDDQLLELGAFQIDSIPGRDGSYYQVESAVFAGSESSLGFRAQGNLRLGSLYASADFRKVSSSDSEPTEEVDYSLIPAQSTQSNLTLQFPLLGGLLGVTSSHSKRRNSEDSHRHTLSYRRNLLHTAAENLEFRADLTLADNNLLALLGLRYYLHRGNWSADVTPRYRYDELPPDPNGSGYQLDASTQFSDPDFAGGALRLAANGASDDASDSAGLSMDYDNHLVQSALSVDHVTGDSPSETSWAGTLVTSVLGDGEAWTLGAQNSSDAAILVTLEGYSPETEFAVLVDGYRRGFARGNATTALQLPAYRSYDVAIRPRRSSFVTYDDSYRSVTLYPGNVARLTWEVQALLVVLGRLVDEAGEPIVNASLEGAHGAGATDEEGRFQAEIPTGGDVVELRFRVRNSACGVVAPIAVRRNGVAFLNTLVCRLSTLPETPRQTPRESFATRQIGATSSVNSPE